MFNLLIVNADYSAVSPGEAEFVFSSFFVEVENGKNALVYKVKNVRNMFWYCSKEVAQDAKYFSP